MCKLKESGFTLIELLGVFVILGVISLIAIPSFTRLLGRSDANYYKSLDGLVINAAKDYFYDNRNLLPNTVGNSTTVELRSLVNAKYIEQPHSKKNDNCTGYIKVTKADINKYDYVSCLICGDYVYNKNICG